MLNDIQRYKKLYGISKAVKIDTNGQTLFISGGHAISKWLVNEFILNKYMVHS